METLKKLRLILSITALVLVIGGVGTTLWRVNNQISNFERTFERVENTTIQAIENIGEIPLLNLEISDLINPEALNVFPGISLESLLPEDFGARFGLNGGEVSVEEVNKNEYHIQVPPFTLLDHDEVDIESMTENNSAFSLITDRIDISETIDSIFRQENQNQIVNRFDSVLRDATESFYTNLVNSVNPQAILSFEFLGAN